MPDRLSELAEALGLAVAADPVEHAVARLFDALRHRDRWLLVVDDVEDPDEVAPFLPDGPGHVVMGTRSVSTPGSDAPVEVPAFERAESVAVLCARCAAVAPDQADRVARGARRSSLGSQPGRGDDSPRAGSRSTPSVSATRPGAQPVATIWTMALDRLSAEDPGAFALLTTVAWLGAEPVPLDLFTRPDLLPAPLADAAGDQAALAERCAALQPTAGSPG